MITYIESPATSIDNSSGRKSLFLAGGITGCPDWQQEMRKLLELTDLVLLNPRRKNFPIEKKGAAFDQICWEYAALKFADSISFWFPQETICPIVLYELGAWSMTKKPIFVGVHPEYARRQDVNMQTRLSRPEVEIVDSLSALASQIKKSL